MRTKSENAKAENEVLNGLQPVVEMADAVKGIEPAASQQPEINPFGTSETGSFEIAPGMTVEQIKAEFFNEDALQEQPEPVYRLDSSGHRYYYTFDENGEPMFYVSVTTLIKQTLPTSPQLIKWIADMGYEESQRYAQERAAYGTFMHSQLAELLIARSYNLNGLKERLKMYIESEQLPGDFINYADDFKKDILAFAQFMKDTDLKPLAIELVLTNPQDGYAGAIDLCAEITIEEKGFFGDVYKTGANAGKPKETKRQRRIRAIIDFKSGRKGFFPEHEVQLLAYKTMWNMHFEKYPVEKVYNWAPKNYTGDEPTYHFKDQTNSKNAEKLPYLVELAKIEDDKRDNTIIVCSGIIDLDNLDLNKNIQRLELSEILKKKRNKDNFKDVIEEWKPITGYEDWYEVSNKGNVRSLYFHSQKRVGDNLNTNPKILSPSSDKDGYLFVSLSNPITGERENKRIHRLVATEFIPNPNNLPYINHKDEDKTNNCSYNLEWCDEYYNNYYGTKNIRTSETLKKPVYQYTINGELVKVYDGAIDAEKETGISRSSICFCIKGRTKTAGGFVWNDKPLFFKDNPETGISPEEVASVKSTTAADVIKIIEQGNFKCLWEAENELPEDVKMVVEAQKINNHRWYSTAQMIVKCADGYVGISGAYQSFSEMQSWSDINVICTARAISKEESAVYDAMIKARESRNKANEAKMKPTESEKPQMGTDVPKKKEKPVKPKKTAKERQKENISALLNDEAEL